jgi:protoheme IX farnesyltransferase
MGGMSLAVRPIVPSRTVSPHRGRPHDASPHRGRPARTKLGAYIALTKPRIIELLLVTTVPTMIVAQRGMPSWWLIVATMVGGTLAAGGANAFNMYIDRDIDRLMPRTQHRPIVTGRVKPRDALIFATALTVASFVWLATFVNTLSAVLALSASAFYVFVYTLWLKRTSTQNIVIGGAAGAVPVLVGWAAVTNGLGWAPWLLFAIIFTWTPPHFWALAIKYRDDYRAANVPMLPAVTTLDDTSQRITRYAAVVWLETIALAMVAHLGLVYQLCAFVLGAHFVKLTFELRRRPTPRQAMKLFTWSISYVTLLFAAMAVDVLVRH